MTEYRIVEAYRKIWIEKQLKGDLWVKVDIKDVPKYHATVADARSWVATIKRGVVYHDAEDAPNLAQDERKAEDVNIGPRYTLDWFKKRIGAVVVLRDINGNAMRRTLCDADDAGRAFASQFIPDLRYSDPR